MVSRPDWSRDETILALHLYQSHWPISGDNDPRIIELSDHLRARRPDIAQSDPKFRNPAGVFRKLTNLLSLDKSNPSLGSPHASSMDRNVFAELGSAPDHVAGLTAQLRKMVNSDKSRAEGAEDDRKFDEPMPPANEMPSSTVSRGPSPHVGTHSIEICESVGHLYIFRLEGVSPANFTPPDESPIGEREVYKIGWCTDLKKRLKTLNSAFPSGARLRWRPYDSRAYSSRSEAYETEQSIFNWVRDQNISLGGEFILANFPLMAGIQARWFR